MTLVVLAAGMGSRYGGLKQIDPITKNGEFIIDFSVYDAINTGFDKVVFIIKEENLEDFKETIGSRISSKIKVEYAFQTMDKYLPAAAIPEGRTKPWGTTHALLCAKDKVDDNFVVINSDDFYGREAFEIISKHLKDAKDDNGIANAAMVGYVLGNTLTENGTVSRGVCKISDSGLLEDIVEKTKIMPDGQQAACLEDDTKYPLSYETIVSMNFWAFTPAIFPLLEKSFSEFIDTIPENPMKSECFLPMSVGDSMKSGKSVVKVFSTNAKWYGVTYSEDKEKVVAGLRTLIDAGEYPEVLWK